MLRENFFIFYLLVDFKFALEKILKHISKEENFAKCLNLIKILLINSNEFNPLVILKIFFKIMYLDFKFNDQDNRKTIQGKYFSIFKKKYFLKKFNNNFNKIASIKYIVF